MAESLEQEKSKHPNGFKLLKPSYVEIIPNCVGILPCFGLTTKQARNFGYYSQNEIFGGHWICAGRISKKEKGKFSRDEELILPPNFSEDQKKKVLTE